MNFVVALKAEALPLDRIIRTHQEKAAASPVPLFGKRPAPTRSFRRRQGACSQGNELPERTIFKSEPSLDELPVYPVIGTLAKGTVYMAARILDDGGEAPFYPTQLLDHKLESSSLQTCSSSASAYPRTDWVRHGSLRLLAPNASVVSNAPEPHPSGQGRIRQRQPIQSIPLTDLP